MFLVSFNRIFEILIFLRDSSWRESWAEWEKRNKVDCRFTEREKKEEKIYMHRRLKTKQQQQQNAFLIELHKPPCR